MTDEELPPDPDFLPVGGPRISLFDVEDPPTEGKALVESIRQEFRDIEELNYLASGQALK